MLGEEATDHRGSRVLAMEDCVALLRRVEVGRLAFIHDGEPELLPVAFGVDGVSPVFRTTWGSKLEALARGHVVALEADALDVDAGVTWSVVVKGRADVEYDETSIARYEALGVPVWAPEPKDPFWVRITPSTVTGRMLGLP